jgi:hypothetical protein
MLAFALAATVATTPAGAAVDQSTVEQAIAFTRARVHAAADAYAKQLGLDGDMVNFCRGQLERDTANMPAGSVPYGVDYSRIPDTARLAYVLDVREEHELGYLKLCLANIKTAQVSSFVDAGTVEQALAFTRARIHAAANAHAEQIGIEKAFVDYCFVQFEHDTARPVDSSIPFGVDYSRIPGTQWLAKILDLRENLERGYVLGCLDNASAALKAAGG